MASTSSDNHWPSKIVKLRAACDQCHAAKVRCSGERAGCRRCQSIDQRCEYSVSRVGKASTNRAKSKSLQTTHTQCNNDSLEEQVTASSATESSETSAQRHLKRSYDVFMDWPGAEVPKEHFSLPNSPWDGAGSLHWQNPTPAANPDFLLPASTDSDLDSMRLNLKYGLSTPPISSDVKSLVSNLPESKPARKDQDSVIPHFPDSVDQNGSQDQPSLLDRFAISDNNKNATSNAGQCMSACMNVIEHLEKKMHDHSVALDEVLRLSKVFFGETERILNLDACRESGNCLLLVSVAINQITSLFEATIGSDHVPLGTLSMVPSLVFGSFQVDPEEQIAFCTRIISKEIRRCRLVLETLSATLQQFSAQAAQSVGLNKLWFISTARRLDALIAVVEAQ